jgi:O-antigen ligase/Flp pilus assembly protein TadD
MEVGIVTTRAPARWVGALVVGSAVAVDPGGLAPFGPARWWVVSTLGFGAAGVALWRGHRPLHRGSTVAWAVLLTFLLVGALVNGDVPTALLGHPERHLGLITWVLFALTFAAGQQLDSDLARTTLARAATAALAVIGVWGLWELLVGPPIELSATTDRLTGPYGSAAFLGAAVCLFAPMAIGRAATSTASTVERIASAITATLGAVALVGSGARAAWVAAAVTGVVMTVRRRPSRRTAVAVGAGLAVALSVVAPRLTDVIDRSAGAASRLDEWTVATRVIADHPLVGVGPDGYRIAVADGIDRHYERTYGRGRVLPDRAHSGPLDVALAGGVPAALAYVALLAFLARRAWRSLAGDTTTAALAAAVTAYGVQQLLLFPLAELDPLWWAFAGALVAVPPTVVAPQHPTARSMGAIAALAMSVIALVAGVLDVAADRLARSALGADDPAIALDDAKRALALRPDDLRYRMVLAVLHRERGTLADVDAAIDAADAALRWSPHDPVALDQWASALTDRAVITGDAADVDDALDAWRELVERDPHRARWQLELGRAAALAGDTDLARASWTTAADLDPSDPTAAGQLANLDG